MARILYSRNVLELLDIVVLPSNRTQLEVSSDSVRKCRGSLEFGTMDSNELGCVNRNELSYRHCDIAAEVHR